MEIQHATLVIMVSAVYQTEDALSAAAGIWNHSRDKFQCTSLSVLSHVYNANHTAFYFSCTACMLKEKLCTCTCDTMQLLWECN